MGVSIPGRVKESKVAGLIVAGLIVARLKVAESFWQSRKSQSRSGRFLRIFIAAESHPTTCIALVRSDKNIRFLRVFPMLSLTVGTMPDYRKSLNKVANYSNIKNRHDFCHDGLLLSGQSRRVESRKPL